VRYAPGVMPLHRLIIAGLVLVVAGGAAAQTPRPGVALALEVTGGRIPGVEPFREIPADTKIQVPPGVRFVFQHYGSCRRFTMTGGAASFRADGVDVTGITPTETRTSCPRKVTLKDDGASAATVMRSAPRPRLSVSTRPDFVLVGPKAEEYVALRVRRGDEVVLEQRLTGGRGVRWPLDKPALAAAATYELELVPARGNAKPLVVSFRTLDGAAADDTITLVSVE